MAGVGNGGGWAQSGSIVGRAAEIGAGALDVVNYWGVMNGIIRWDPNSDREA